MNSAVNEVLVQFTGNVEVEHKKGGPDKERNAKAKRDKLSRKKEKDKNLSVDRLACLARRKTEYNQSKVGSRKPRPAEAEQYKSLLEKRIASASYMSDR